MRQLPTFSLITYNILVVFFLSITTSSVSVFGDPEDQQLLLPDWDLKSTIMSVPEVKTIFPASGPSGQRNGTGTYPDGILKGHPSSRPGPSGSQEKGTNPVIKRVRTMSISTDSGPALVQPATEIRTTPDQELFPPGHRNGAYPLVGAAIAGGIGAALGALDGPFRAATFAAVGGAVGGFLGGYLDDGEFYTILGAAGGGYLGGVLGGFGGGISGQIADSLATAAASVALGAGGVVLGRETGYGVPGAVVGGVSGALLGAGLGKMIVGPTATVLVCGGIAAFGAGAGGYLGSTDAVGRPRR